MLAMLVLGAQGAHAHSASDAYLSLSTRTSGAAQPITGEWDIALRDLAFVLDLDADGDGRLTWGEIRQRQSDIEAYAYRHLRIDGGPGNACRINPQRQLIDDHADGAYAALFFEVQCARAPRRLALDYSLFFSIDPSHRGIFVLQSGADTTTAVLSPDNAHLHVLVAAARAADAPVPRVDAAWIRWLPGAIPAAGYLTLTNAGDRPAVLLSASSPLFADVSLHRTENRAGSMQMAGVDRITIPPHATLTFETTGYHLMLMQPATPVKPGMRVTIILRFADAPPMPVEFEVRNPDGSRAAPTQ
jgi:copper(I)-binding protein